MIDNSDSRKVYTLDDLPVLKKSHVKIQDTAKVLEKISNIVSGKKENLQIITDYDLTMTKQHINGEKTPSSFGLLSLCKHLQEGFIEDDQKLKEKYYHIEVDPYLTPEQKSPHMIEWYHESEKLWDGVHFDLDELIRVVKDSGPELRDGTVDLCRLSERSKIPILVLSAGMGNVLTEVLKYHGLFENDYLHIVSNFLKLENGIVRGYGCHENGLFIHPFNKCGLGCEEYFKKIGPERHNVILLGDSLGDAHMDKGVPEIKNVLKIGFLYGTADFIEKSLPQYLKSFDIVLIDDQTMDVARAILDLLVTH